MSSEIFFTKREFDGVEHIYFDSNKVVSKLVFDNITHCLFSSFFWIPVKEDSVMKDFRCFKCEKTLGSKQVEPCMCRVKFDHCHNASYYIRWWEDIKCGIFSLENFDILTYLVTNHEFLTIPVVYSYARFQMVMKELLLERTNKFDFTKEGF